jgi:hypothetical protein
MPTGHRDSHMNHSLHDKTLDAKKARILINALIDCAKAGVRASFSLKEMLYGVSMYLECGTFSRENWRSYPRVSDAARLIRDAAEKDWRRHLTFEHARPFNVMWQMLLDERATLTLERAAFIIAEYPPVLITVEEDIRMSKRGFMHGGVPEERYAHIPISGFSLRSDAALLRLKKPDPPARKKAKPNPPREKPVAAEAEPETPAG